ncbi:zinc finger protein 718-like [Biomphalaria glabrata]|uniref:Zinc finger protein 718-like n=1 Tax=Biomphalaria glabrata TaxID=6526 RepID=A0A2C9JP99_BIOGL|nr:zinc finger protein 718-like [Biomphalaria glabrata]
MNDEKAELEQSLQASQLSNLNKLTQSSIILPSCSVQNKAVFFKLKANTSIISSNLTRLKNLLPKISSDSVAGCNQNESFQMQCVSDLNKNESLNNEFSSTPTFMANQQYQSAVNKDDTTQVNVDLQKTTKNNKIVEVLLSQYDTNLPEENFDKNDTEMGVLEESEVPQVLLNSIQSNNPEMLESQVSYLSLDSTCDKDINNKVVKKTKIEAYVKMVVCRKITIQKVLAHSGQVLETKVKTEEEEPVILDVDCVETEDMLTDSAELSFDNAAELAASKWSSLDGGLKFLSAVSESRQKIGKNCIKDKILESSLKNISKLIESASQKEQVYESPSEEYQVEVCMKKESNLPIKEEHVTDSEHEDWNEELNDDSEDYVPVGHSLKKSLSKNQTHNDQTDHCDKPVTNENSIILIPKKRGRKRKWDNALGMSSNLRSCVFCNKHFNTTTACSEHMKLGTCISSVFCFICSKPYNSENELEKHLEAHCNDKKPRIYECIDCNRSYRTHAGYEKHFRMGTCLKRDDFEDVQTGSLQCDLCPSRFSTQAYLRLHRYKVHENPKDIHTCLDCGKKFYSSIGYNKHKNGRPCSEPLKCLICGKTYSSKAKESFKIHMKHHKTEIGGITFNCDECGRGYMTQMALKKHKLSHTGVKPYKCETCGKAFAMRYMVKDHARTHTGERPYLCSLCGNAFSNKGHLGRHLRSHENRTLQKRGRPKKIRLPVVSEGHETELKIINLGQALQMQGLEGQSIQVVNSQLFDSHSSGQPMIIQTNDNTIIIAEGWPPQNIVNPAISLPNS